MPKNTGYVGGGTNRPKGPTHDNPVVYPDSYKDSPAKTPAMGKRVTRHGFSRNPKQDGVKKTSPAFPDSVDSGGAKGPKGDLGMADYQGVGGTRVGKKYDHGEPSRKNDPNTGY